MQIPHSIGPHRVVAFTRIGSDPSTNPDQGIAITRDRDGFNVHTVFLADREIGRWEGQNGRYGVTWQRALDAMVDRAAPSPPP
ncbi:hypothetical protein [Paractinoplanes rishiriensis]|uniref:Uncharacterized protein n=1 Tax=Paractinoplanes rishiriensis TaxID=1050105 RepID=A0A919K1J5_9ACTN|nr:hypothetical protein [Actinoplanes rishiriensis]GIE98955.1 hypothetical protein Ari01nite_64200 [Actinoplanes rishiriensis]